jgi:hypothetical protein
MHFCFSLIFTDRLLWFVGHLSIWSLLLRLFFFLITRARHSFAEVWSFMITYFAIFQDFANLRLNLDFRLPRRLLHRWRTFGQNRGPSTPFSVEQLPNHKQVSLKAAYFGSQAPSPLTFPGIFAIRGSASGLDAHVRSTPLV